ncbi:MAG TPA: TetR/AcrR family transcriptional regulator [Alicycliphilus sp.]|nr:TetR/AcrR family transcriptional regulator [Alicycliphilus sp.]
MPRVSRAETEKNRAAIERASSQLIRERGLGVSVADLMGAAGLTHGGFYGHFQSKDELKAIACASALAESAERWKKRMAKKDPEQARAALVEGYLTERNRSAPGTGCPLAALAVDVAREERGKPVRAAFNDGLEQLIELLTATQPCALDEAARRSGALAQMATLVGAMVLARATSDSPLSDELLAAARENLLGSTADTHPDL